MNNKQERKQESGHKWPNDQDQRQLRPNVVLEAARSCAVRCIAWLGVAVLGAQSIIAAYLSITDPDILKILWALSALGALYIWLDVSNILSKQIIFNAKMLSNLDK